MGTDMESKKMIEIWTFVKGYDREYSISTLGRIFSNKNGKFLSTYDAAGYQGVDLYKNSKRRKTTIHRLMAENFLCNPENKREVNHIDGVKNNDIISNLEWVTTSENGKHAFAIGLKKNGPYQRKIAAETCKKYKSKKVAKYSKNGHILEVYKSYRHAAENNNVTASAIGLSIKQKRSCKGFIYKDV